MAVYRQILKYPSDYKSWSGTLVLASVLHLDCGNASVPGPSSHQPHHHHRKRADRDNNRRNQCHPVRAVNDAIHRKVERSFEKEGRGAGQSRIQPSHLVVVGLK
jgi:hypothetical protein